MGNTITNPCWIRTAISRCSIPTAAKPSRLRRRKLLIFFRFSQKRNERLLPCLPWRRRTREKKIFIVLKLLKSIRQRRFPVKMKRWRTKYQFYRTVKKSTKALSVPMPRFLTLPPPLWTGWASDCTPWRKFPLIPRNWKPPRRSFQIFFIVCRI